MPTSMRNKNVTLPSRYKDLIAMMPPRAIHNDKQLEDSIEKIHSLMALQKLTREQESYMETLVQLVQVYESTNHAIDTGDLSGIDSLKHLLDENEMNASDLARLLGVHVSMGSKILKQERSLTVDHLMKLSFRFKVRPELFIDRH